MRNENPGPSIHIWTGSTWDKMCEEQDVWPGDKVIFVQGGGKLICCTVGAGLFISKIRCVPKSEWSKW